MPDGSVLATFRPTWRQAVGRSARAALLLMILTVVVLSVAARRPWPPWPAGPLVAVLAFAAWLAAGALVARRRVVAATETGLRGVRPRSREVSWQRVVDVRTERRGARSVVVVDLDTGRRWRLAAPYDGPVLHRDLEFEQKLFTLRNLWETYRTRLPEFPDAAGGTWDGAAG
jgi:hypothetical protein